MEINLSKNDVMRILANHFNLKIKEYGPSLGPRYLKPVGDDIYWEGNPKPEA